MSTNREAVRRVYRQASFGLWSGMLSGLGCIADIAAPARKGRRYPLSQQADDMQRIGRDFRIALAAEAAAGGPRRAG
ncbi:hypothetical protein [Caenispirillum bisanense]|uniref:hypothetical protein n=1 Tax=Caenispirillum bisanense TaxID=414052 RepID=UPI0031DD0934